MTIALSAQPTVAINNSTLPTQNSTSINSADGLPPNCAICSFYSDGTLIVQFQPAIQQKNGTLTPIKSPQEMAVLAGPSWLGHQLCCGTDDELFQTKPGQNVTLYSWKGERKLQVKAIGAKRPSPLARAGTRHAASFKKKGTTRITTLKQPLHKRGTTSKPNIFNATSLPPPTCLPLVSVNPVANLYHEALIGVSGANTRWGTGFPVPVGYAIDCSNVDAPCQVDQTFSNTFTSSLSYSISTSNTASYTRSLGQTVTTGQESSYASSISDTLEQSWSHTSSQEKSSSVSDTLSDTLTKTSEVSLSKAHTTSDETTVGGSETRESSDTRSSGGSLANSWSQHGSSSSSSGSSSSGTTGSETSNTSGSSTSDHNTSGSDSQSCANWSDSLGASVGFSGFGVSASASYNHEEGGSQCNTNTNTHESGYDTSNSNTSGSSSSTTTGQDHSNTNEAGWQNEVTGTNNWDNSHTDSHGTTSSWSAGHTDSDTTTSTRSDSISDAVTNSHTTEYGFSNTESDTVGNSKSKTFGSTNTYSSSNTKSNEIQNTIANAQAVDQGTVQSIDQSSSVTQHFGFTVPINSCRIPVISTRIQSVAIPWACKDPATNETVVVATDVYPTYDKGLPIVSVIPCSSKLIEFRVDNDQFNQRNAQSGGTTNRDTLASGQVLTAGSFLTSRSGSHTLTMDTTGALIFRQYTKVLWTSETDYLTGYSPQARITDQGHLVIEAKGFFNKVRTNDTQFIIMWSTQPMNQQFQVGIYGGTGYSLVVEEDTSALFLNQNGVPDLVLYDSKAVPIWQALNTKYKNRYGYKHPFDYELPTNVITKPNRQYQNDPHNAIDPAITLFTNTSTLTSRDASCGAKIAQNTGIVSPNGRFKVILDGTGNMLVKDGTRTMWSPRTANMWYATPPYTMQLSSVGELFISDSKGWNTFRTANIFVNTTSGPYTLNMTDSGRLSILDNKKFEVWTAWPLAMTNTTLFGWMTFPIKWCDSACEACRPASISELVSNDRVLNTLIDGESVITRYSNSSLALSNGTLTFNGVDGTTKSVIYRSAVADINNVLTLGNSGDLVLTSTNGSTLWSNGIKAANGTYRLFVSNEVEDVQKPALGATLVVVDANNNTVWDYPSTCVSPRYRHTNGTCVSCADPQAYFDGPSNKCTCNAGYTSVVDYETNQPVCSKCVAPQGLFSGQCLGCPDKNAHIGTGRTCTCNTGYTNQTDVATKVTQCAVPCPFPKAIKNGVCTGCSDSLAHMDTTGTCVCNDGNVNQTDVGTHKNICAPACLFPRAIKNGVCSSCDLNQPQHWDGNGNCVCNTGNVWQLETSSNLWKCMSGYFIKSWFGTTLRENDGYNVDLDVIPAGADGQWETWRIIYHSSTVVSLQTYRGTYLVPNNNQWVALSNTITADAKWTVVMNGGYWGFKSSGGKFLSAKQDYSVILQSSMQEWEFWTVSSTV
ncbi:hypothetical protein HDV00_003563 [Rhizophlyctis rosea]|nr:hypothetical protein HDV00_003563 [Rhizophlyctis rosea]